MIHSEKCSVGQFHCVHLDPHVERDCSAWLLSAVEDWKVEANAGEMGQATLYFLRKGYTVESWYKGK